MYCPRPTSFLPLLSLRVRLPSWLPVIAIALGALSSTAPLQAQGDAITLYGAQGVGTPGHGSLLYEGSDGNFYGVGSSLFRLSPEGVATKIVAVPGAGAIVMGHDGNLYGTSTVPNGAGSTPTVTIFQATPTGQVKTIATIPPSIDLDGNDNVGPLVEDAAGNFYGVLTTGGTLGNGAIFKAAPDGTVSLVHAFSNIDDNNVNTDGWEPNSYMVIDPVGNIYGLTSLGGTAGNGTIYEVTAGGNFSAIYSFAANENHDFYGGSLAVDHTGSLYFPGSSYSPPASPIYFIERFVGGALSPLHTFSPLTPDLNGVVVGYNDDGSQSNGVTLGSDGNLYGVCGLGGPSGNGTTFRLTTDGAFTVLYAAGAGVPPTLGSDGNLYGENSYAGQSFYRLESTLVPAISSANTLTLSQGTPVAYQVVASNGPILRYSADNLPGTLSLNTATGLINGAPLVGTYTFDVGADNASGTGYLTVTLTVITPAPAAPVITVPTAPLAATVGKPFTYQVNASQSPGSYSATGLPPGLIVDPKTGLIHGTAANFGKYLVQIQAANASGQGTASFEIDVVAAALPVVTVVGSNPDAAAASGQVGDFTLTLSAVSGVDLDVAYTVKGSAVPGVDYQMLKGTAKIKAGKITKNVKVVPVGTLGGAAKKVVKLTLQPGTGYAIGTPGPVKVKIVNP